MVGRGREGGRRSGRKLYEERRGDVCSGGECSCDRLAGFGNLRESVEAEGDDDGRSTLQMGDGCRAGQAGAGGRGEKAAGVGEEVRTRKQRTYSGRGGGGGRLRTAQTGIWGCPIWTRRLSAPLWWSRPALLRGLPGPDTSSSVFSSGFLLSSPSPYIPPALSPGFRLILAPRDARHRYTQFFAPYSFTCLKNFAGGCGCIRMRHTHSHPRQIHALQSYVLMHVQGSGVSIARHALTTETVLLYVTSRQQLGSRHIRSRGGFEEYQNRTKGSAFQQTLRERHSVDYSTVRQVGRALDSTTYRLPTVSQHASGSSASSGLSMTHTGQHLWYCKSATCSDTIALTLVLDRQCSAPAA
ncbi:hypothetical protein C2E23DRAFT_595763 [Lenzites betulinus]|nr:hypothetical protein C2E23DRAFT_595763 [Lenzites betulinus]